MNSEEQHIIQRVMHVFVTYGVRSLSLDTIAIHIPISKKELLKVAKNKEELIRKIFEYRASIATEIGNQIMKNPAVTNAIDIMLHMSVLMSKACNEFNPQLDFEFKKYYPTLFAEYEAQKHTHIVQSMTHILERGQKEGIFLAEINPSITAQYYFEQVQKHHESMEEYTLSRDVVEQMILHMTQFMNELCTESGMAHYKANIYMLEQIIENWNKIIDG